MKLEDIQSELNEIDKAVLDYSVDKGLSLEELTDFLDVLNTLKDKFIEISFLNKELTALEDIRLYILENTYNVQIFIKEMNGEDTFEEMEGFKALETKGIYQLREEGRKNE